LRKIFGSGALITRAALEAESGEGWNGMESNGMEWNGMQWNAYALDCITGGVNLA
jgi:hypothetical protein